jgi:N-acetylglucosaminyl-diphospho-decaprenol L-rhamnosyltransferase
VPRDIDISIIIVNWNAQELLCECLRSIYDNTHNIAFEVIVIDNASNDKSCECIEIEFEKVKLIRSQENLGFAKGNNLAARHALGRYFVLLNPDTVVRKDSIRNLFAYAKAHPQGGTWGGVCELPDGSIDPGCRQIPPDIKTRFQMLVRFAANRVQHLDRSSSFEGETPVVHGAYMMVRFDIWRQMKGFDESFILYAEETDLCRRIRQAGYGVYMTGKSRITHNAASGDPHNPLCMLNKTRGIMQFYRKYYSTIQATCAAVLIWLHSLERVIGSFVLMPYLGIKRCQRLRRRMLLVLCHPARWWYGWKGQSL